MTVSSSSHHRLKGILSVTVLKAKNLKKSDWFSENDCYTVVSLEPLSLEATDKKHIKRHRFTMVRIQFSMKSLFFLS